MSNIYVTATPIGNLEDISLRALRILKEVDIVLCEDTRVTKKLLSHFDISTPTMSYHANSKLSKVEKILELLREEKDLALVSDAGTPTISDPGSRLIYEIRKELPYVNIVAVPGPSALTAALSIAGVKSAEFIFRGFLPHKKGRETIFKEIAAGDRATVFYESPHRILKTLESLKKYAPLKNITICREITKMYEEVLKGNAEDIINILNEDIVKQKGEFVVIVSD